MFSQLIIYVFANHTILLAKNLCFFTLKPFCQLNIFVFANQDFLCKLEIFVFLHQSFVCFLNIFVLSTKTYMPSQNIFVFANQNLSIGQDKSFCIARAKSLLLDKNLSVSFYSNTAIR